MITPLSTPVPSRSAPPEVFIARMDTLLSELPLMVAQLNAFGASLNTLATTSSSVTSLAVGTGSKALTVDTGKSYQVGMTVKIASTASPTNWMLGEVVSYDTVTGALVATVSGTQGSGTMALWTISLAATGGASLGANVFTGPQDEAQGADIASASTIDLENATGNLVDVTGTATITAITLNAGAERVVRFTGACTLTHGASLVLPGGVNIVTAAGDFVTFRGYSGGIVRCTGISFARGSDSASTGDVKVTLKNVADTGWVMMDDKTIGNAASGATGRANADTVALFTLLYNNISNTYCAVSGGRGATAAADYAANKTIALPKALGRALGISGSSASLTARALGEVLGEETHTLTAAEGPIHSHPASQAAHNHNISNASANPGGGGNSRPQSVLADGAAPVTDVQTPAVTVSNNTTGGGAHNNMQPTSFMNAMVKL
ncbi:MAG: hypothetical protein KJ958_05550 [Gammaproteobacteria bacterium]|nr:hypothetical protein [Gammaproteobacteria bacterium]MBU1978619.1 hypothetical protein [Gammaproteobacteria bacterium]